MNIRERARGVAARFGGRSRRTHWAVVACCALLIAGLAHRQITHLERARAQWGTRAAVWVSSADIEAGTRLTSAHVHQRSVPIAVVPRHAVSTSPLGTTLRKSVGSNEMLVSDDLAEPERLLGPGEHAIFVPSDATTNHLRPGDVVTAVAQQTGIAGLDHPPAAARVIGRDDNGLLVAMEGGAALALASALNDGRVTFVLMPRGTR